MPLGVIVWIFYNYYYEVKFKRPSTSYMRNFRMLQTIMQVTGDLFEVVYHVLENFFFWHSKEKTLFTLNILAGASLGAIPLMFIPFRYIIAAGLWGIVSLSSPFFCAVFKSLL
jgi:hypothetical protein